MPLSSLDRYTHDLDSVCTVLSGYDSVGGNFQDLVTRSLTAVLGAVWSGAAYAAGDGNPYVMGVFAFIYLLPMLYRLTQSTHPVSPQHSSQVPWVYDHSTKMLNTFPEVRTCWMPILRRHISCLGYRRGPLFSSGHDRWPRPGFCGWRGRVCRHQLGSLAVYCETRAASGDVGHDVFS